MIQSLQTNNVQLAEKINTIEKDNINLTEKFQCQRVWGYYLKEIVLMNLTIEIC